MGQTASPPLNPLMDTASGTIGLCLTHSLAGLFPESIGCRNTYSTQDRQFSASELAGLAVLQE